MKKVLDRYQPKISEILLIEDIISNINENNLQQSIETIKTSKFLQSQDNLKVIMKMVGRIIKYRKQHIKCFFALIDSIFSVITSYFNKKEVMLFFSSKLIFLKLLYDNYISIEDIVSFYGICNERILYFYPEVKNFLLHNSYFNENILLFTKYRSIIDYFSKHEEKIDFINDPRLKIGNVDKLSVLIQKDDIDSFQQKISLSNIDTQTYKIKLTNFEVKKFLDKEIFLIEYAALHGSLKIFKFLLMNDSKLSNKLFQYAIFGRNNEIIHLSEKMLEAPIENIYECLRLTVISHQNGETAIETAARLGYREILNFLKSQFNEKGIETCNELEINTNKYYPTHYNDPWLLQNKFYQNIKVREEFQLLF